MRAKSGWLSAPNMSRHRDICSRCTMTQPPSDVVKIKCSQLLHDALLGPGPVSGQALAGLPLTDPPDLSQIFRDIAFL